ncbi:MAG: adenylate/guanylate cyclase domain-containing protein [Magnetococcus sp. WYHC-3]
MNQAQLGKQSKAIAGRYDIIFTVLLFSLALLAEYHEVLAFLEDQTLSIRQLLRTSYGDPTVTAPVEEVVLVNTDETFYKEYGSFPVRRADLGRIVTNLKTLGAKVIALDILMDFPNSYGDDPDLAAALKDAGNTLLVSQAEFKNGTYQKINYPTDVLNAVSRSAYTNISSNSALWTSLSRLTVYPEITGEPNGWPYAVTALAMFLGVEPQLEGRILRFGSLLQVPLDHNNQFFIDFPALPGGVRFLSQARGISAMEFLDIDDLDEQEREELSWWVKDRIVLVGDTSEVSHDWFDTPVGMVYGVEIIADTIHSMMRAAPLRPASETLEALVAAILALLLLLSGVLKNPITRAVAGLVLGLIFMSAAALVYVNHGLVLSVAYNLLAMALSFTVINTRYYLQEMGQKRMIKSAFGQYLSPKVVDILVRDPNRLSLGGEERVMTAFFSDVAGFSGISENLTPKELVELLNLYLTDMCNIIAQYDGTVDKFEGDAIIAFWGAPLEQPDHARLCCLSSIDQQKRMQGMREELTAQGRPLLRVRMGINTGPMVVGNMGSATRMDYTIMGDSVNLASRLEGVNKFYNSYTIISGSTYAQAAEFVDVRELDQVRVVGKKEPVTIYELLDRKNQTPGPLADAVQHFQRGLAAYRDRDFTRAISHFQNAMAANGGQDGPSEVFIKRCRSYLEYPPPADWDGVFSLTSKG